MPETAVESVDAVTVAPEVSTEVHSLSFTGKFFCLAGLTVLFFSVALTIRTYMPCPFWDQWDAVAQMADGAKPTSWHWLWSQHNEHRLVMTRLLIWIDYAVFGGRSVSLFVGTYVIQMLAWGSIAFSLERFTPYPSSLKRLLQGIFLLCLFYPLQAENFTWAFQVSFVACFAIGTITLLGVSFFEEVPTRRRPLVVTLVAAAPMLAAVNLSAGLLIGPAVLALAVWKKLPLRIVAIWTLVFTLSTTAYMHGNASVGAAGALRDPHSVLLYMVAYFDTAWSFSLLGYGHLGAIGSFCLLLAVAVRAIRQKISPFEQFALAECFFVLLTAFVTAIGRVREFGVAQAFSSRYQTPALLYWAACASLLLLQLAHKPAARKIAAVLLPVSACWLLLLLPAYWRSWVSIRRPAIAACSVLMRQGDALPGVGVLHPKLATIQRGARLLSRKWPAR